MKRGLLGLFIILLNSKELQNIWLLCALNRICHAIPLVLRTLPFFFFFFFFFNVYALQFWFNCMWNGITSSLLNFGFLFQNKRVLSIHLCALQMRSFLNFCTQFESAVSSLHEGCLHRIFFLLIFIGWIIWMNRIPVFQSSIWIGLWYCACL